MGRVIGGLGSPHAPSIGALRLWLQLSDGTCRRLDVTQVPSRSLAGRRLDRDAEAVRALRTRLEADGVPVIERDDEPELVSFKCLDPDGWRVEAYWEPP